MNIFSENVYFERKLTPNLVQKEIGDFQNKRLERLELFREVVENNKIQFSEAELLLLNEGCTEPDSFDFDLRRTLVTYIKDKEYEVISYPELKRNEDINKNLREKLSLIRRFLCLTHKELANKLEIDEREIKDVEEGNTDMSVDLFFALAKYLDISSHFLYHSSTVLPIECDRKESLRLYRGIEANFGLSFCAEKEHLTILIIDNDKSFLGLVQDQFKEEETIHFERAENYILGLKKIKECYEMGIRIDAIFINKKQQIRNYKKLIKAILNESAYLFFNSIENSLFLLSDENKDFGEDKAYINDDLSLRVLEKKELISFLEKNIKRK